MSATGAAVQSKSDTPAGLCSGFGQWHSPNNKRDPRDYLNIPLDAIRAMLTDPPSVEKSNAQWVIFSTLPSRVHAEQHMNGRFWALWADIDDAGGMTFDDIIGRAGDALLDFWAYTSRSATEENPKTRIIVPLAESVSGGQFVILQKILNDRLEFSGITPDRATERAGQVCYLPNRGQYYRFHVEEYAGPMPADAWADDIAKEQERIRAVEKAAKEARERAKAKATLRIQTGCKSPIDAYRTEFDLPMVFDFYGYVRRGNRWLSPNSGSKSPGVSLTSDGRKWLSTHGSDSAIGQPTSNGTMGDAFDLFVFYEHGGSRDAAIKAAARMFSIEKRASAHNEQTSGLPEPPCVPKNATLGTLLKLAVEKEYCDMLGDESWYFPNLIIKGQILVIIAKSGGGKTTVCFDFVAPWILKHHPETNILFLDCDSAVSDHKRMFKRAKSNGPRFHWINPITHGKGPDYLIDILTKLVERKERLDGQIIFLDTLKKFVNLLDKRSVKPFFVLMRQLVSLGATIVLLGHANKYRDAGGNLVFEGVGDVQSDTDALIFFERMGSIGGIDVTSIIDPDKGAKVRGLYEPVSFHIERETRTVTQHKDPVPVPNWCGSNDGNKATSEDVEDAVREYLTGKVGHTKQSDVIDELTRRRGFAYHKVRAVLKACAVHEQDAATKGQIFYSVGRYNQKSYSVFQNSSLGGFSNILNNH